MSGRKLPMSDAEIAASYRGAKNPEAQVGILADLNLCSRGEMEEVLIGLGLREERPKTRRGRNLTFDAARARALWHEGKSDSECAAALGIPEKRYREWRRRENLYRYEGKKADQESKKEEAVENMAQAEKMPVGKPAKKTTAAESAGAVTVKQLFEVLDEAIVEGYGEAWVTVEGQAFRALRLTAQRTFGGTERQMRAELEGEVL